MIIQEQDYQRIYDDELETIHLEVFGSKRFFELDHAQRVLVEALIDLGAKTAAETVFDPDILLDTLGLAEDMGNQLYDFANMLKTHVRQPDESR
jgi:hypothetical protein